MDKGAQRRVDVEMSQGKRILIVSVNWIGDVIFTTPFIRTVRQANPDSYIACLLHPRCREMLEANPRINEIIIYDEELRHKGIIGKFKLINYIRKNRFDTAFILHRSFTKALIPYLAGIRERIGYPTKNRRVLLTKAAEEPDEDTHKVEYFLNIAGPAGMNLPQDNSYEFFIEDSDRKFVKDMLEEGGVSDKDILVTICPGGNWGPKRWPKENFAVAADLIAEKFGARIAIAGAKKDIELAEEIRKSMRNKPLITCGKTTLRQLGALLERSKLVIANDTGPMHIAVCMKARVIALFGPTSWRITGPYGRGDYKVISRNETCEVPCYDFNCKDNSCMAAISVEEVYQTAEEFLR